jgi:hypothetical protein
MTLNHRVIGSQPCFKTTVISALMIRPLCHVELLGTNYAVRSITFQKKGDCNSTVVVD